MLCYEKWAPQKWSLLGAPLHSLTYIRSSLVTYVCSLCCTSFNCAKQVLQYCYLLWWNLTFSFTVDLWNNLLFYKTDFLEYYNFCKDFCYILLYPMELDGQKWEYFPRWWRIITSYNSIKIFNFLLCLWGIVKISFSEFCCVLVWLLSMQNIVKCFFYII